MFIMFFSLFKMIVDDNNGSRSNE